PLALVCALSAAACDQSKEPAPVPTPIAKPNVTESFTGTVLPLGSFQYQFKVVVDSEVHITLVSEMSVAIEANPDADPPVVAKPAGPVNYPLNVRIGQTTITTLCGACTNLKSVTTTAGGTPQLTGQALNGTYCVDVSDLQGTLPEAITVNVTISHS